MKDLSDYSLKRHNTFGFDVKCKRFVEFVFIAWLQLSKNFYPSFNQLPAVYTTNAASHAIEHCSKITKTAYLRPSSRFTVAIAATHGVYNSEKTRKTNAVSGVNKSGSFDVSPPNNTLNVLTTLSFAINPVINAVDTRQSLIPSG